MLIDFAPIFLWLLINGIKFIYSSKLIFLKIKMKIIIDRSKENKEISRFTVPFPYPYFLFESKEIIEDDADYLTYIAFM